MRIQNAAQLEQAIALLEAQQEVQKATLVNQYNETVESLRPVNLIKNAYRRVTDTPDLANKLIGTSMGVGAGILSKRLLLGRSGSILKKMLGLALEVTVANAVAKRSDGIRQKGAQLIKKIINK